MISSRKGKDPLVRGSYLAPQSDEFYKRQRRHRHNSFFGHVGMAKANMNAIIDSDSTTPMAKRYADEILNSLVLLGEELKVRVDPKEEEK